MANSFFEKTHLRARIHGHQPTTISEWTSATDKSSDLQSQELVSSCWLVMRSKGPSEKSQRGGVEEGRMREDEY